MIERLITRGDKIYSRKSNYGDFIKSLVLYDSAFRIAERNKDTLLLAESIFAKGRAFDALNRDPQKTIDFYTDAAKYYSALPGKKNEALYIRHLVAHSYDKVNDSVRCVKELQKLYGEIVSRPDSEKQELRFTAEMALVSTVVRNYALADSILQNLTKREWIANDPAAYDYLDHYYLTKARLSVINKLDCQSPYLDSLENVFNSSRNFSDSAFFSNELVKLFRCCSNHQKTIAYESINFQLNEELTAGNSMQSIQARLSEMEAASAENKRRESANLLKNRTTIAWLLASMLLAISAFAFFLIKKNREVLKKKTELQVSNTLLNEKSVQNELLNKEIHHRVKNNLQMIMSLVYMQERTTKTSEAKTNLQDIRMRIEGVAALHEQLIGKDEALVSLKDYVTKMVNAVAGLVQNNRHIFTHLDIEPFTLPAGKSFPLGQILNEWITNSVKHAGNTEENLVIYLSIKKPGTDVLVQYRDSGKPGTFGEKEDAKLGMNIIQLLVTQLGGSLQPNPSNQFEYTLIFDADGE